MALLSTAGVALDEHPEVTRWAVGGHSMGGSTSGVRVARDREAFNAGALPGVPGLRHTGSPRPCGRAARSR